MEEDTVYLGGAWDASQSHVQKQGFTSALQEVIQAVLSKEWGKQREFRSVGSLFRSPMNQLCSEEGGRRLKEDPLR